MEVTLSVRRYDPDAEAPEAYYQDFSVDVDDTATVLDGLIKIREETDGTLALRCSCRSAICGSCAMKVNGRGVLACNTKLSDYAGDPGGKVRVDPAGNMGLIKDLVVEFDVHWDKVRAVDPWLKPSGPAPEQEYIASEESMLHLAGVMGCIQCGVCVSDCTVLEVGRQFPLALPRWQSHTGSSPTPGTMRRSTDSGSWIATAGSGTAPGACSACRSVQGCRSNGRIMSLRELAMEAGYMENNGARHAVAFTEIVERNGLLNEFWLTVKTFGCST